MVIRDKHNDGSSAERYQALMRFLDGEKERVELQSSSLKRSSGSGGGKVVTNCVVGLIVNPNNDRNNRADSSPYNGQDSNRTRQWNPCPACNNGAIDLSVFCHPMESCSICNSLPQKDKESKVKCIKHPFRTDHSMTACMVKDEPANTARNNPTISCCVRYCVRQRQ